MANVIEEAAQAIRTRLAQLDALLAEQQQLKKALEALEGLLRSEGGETAAPKKARPGRQAERAPASAARRPARGRSRRGASRADQFVQLVRKRPGITVGEAAEQLKTSRQTIYNVTARLQRDGRLRKDGRGFYPAQQAPASASRTATSLLSRARGNSLVGNAPP